MYSEKTVEYAQNIISHRLRTLIGHHGFRKGDRADLAQDLLCDVLARLGDFDPSRGTIGTFIARVVEHRISIIIRHRKAGMRDRCREEGSLNDEVADGNGGTVERAETLDAALARPGRSDEDRAALVLDVRTVVEGLPEDLRDLCLRLHRESVAEISRATDIPRTTLYGIVRRLRRRFRETCLHEYL